MIKINDKYSWGPSKVAGYDTYKTGHTKKGKYYETFNTHHANLEQMYKYFLANAIGDCNTIEELIDKTDKSLKEIMASIEEKK